MHTLDWIIVALVLVGGMYGFQRGFLVNAMALAGFIGGAVLGTRLGPQLLHDGSRSPFAPLFGLLGALFGGAVLASGLEELGWLARIHLRFRSLALVDGVLGAALSAALTLGVLWILSAVGLQTPAARALRPDVQRSVILRAVNSALPPSGTILHALARFDPFPRLVGPPALVAPPTRRSSTRPECAWRLPA